MVTDARRFERASVQRERAAGQGSADSAAAEWWSQVANKPSHKAVRGERARSPVRPCYSMLMPAVLPAEITSAAGLH